MDPSPRPESVAIMATFDEVPADVQHALAMADFTWEPWQLRAALGSEDEPLTPAVVKRLDHDGHRRLAYLRANGLGPYAVGKGGRK